MSKLFEKLVAKQIFTYFEDNNLFYAGQHGFRKNASCETALQDIISGLYKNLDKRMINMLLFIDSRKTFNTVDADLLVLKLIHYEFDNQSLNLVKNYFTNLKQPS